MTQKITPCLWFEKDCEEGINIYISIFNGAPGSKNDSRIISIQRYPENIPNPPWGEGMSGKIITAIFELAGERFMALDGGPGVFPKGGPVSFTIDCESQAEVDHFWNKLSDGGDPKSQQCGWLADKYGFNWQVVPKILGELLNDPDKEKSGRVMQAMLKMKKINIQELKDAYNQ